MAVAVQRTGCLGFVITLFFQGLTNDYLQMVYDPNKKLDDAAREKLVEEQAARMKAMMKARREREVETKVEAEREKRRKAFAPHWDDPSDDESDISMDVSSSEAGRFEEKATPMARPAAQARGITAPTTSKICTPPTQSSITSKAPTHANKPQNSPASQSASSLKVSKLSIDTKKRSHDEMSDSCSSEKVSRDGSPLFEEPPASSSAIAMSPKDLASLPRISKKRKMSASAQVSPGSNASSGHGVAPLPEWYLNAVMPKGPSKETMSAFRRIWTQFDKLKENMKVCTTTKDPQARTEPLQKISELLHTLEFTKIPHPFALASKKILHNDQGLKRIADFHDSESAYNFPWYLRADAQELYNKWLSREWDPDMFRGITNMVKVPNGAKGQFIDPKFKKDWRFFGEGQFVAGQWWPMQLCAVRDGAHGSAQAGIAGIKTTEDRPGGATSIVLSEGHKEDIDEGHEIWYCGTEAKIGDTEPTVSTKFMMESLSSDHPVRVMRSSKLPAGNKYRPTKGFRYDGLYKVIGSQVIDKLKHHYLFHLRRIPGQIELRCEGEAARPTPRELQEYESEMKKYGRRGSFD